MIRGPEGAVPLPNTRDGKALLVNRLSNHAPVICPGGK